jgi:hypothetical protein
MQIVYTKLTDGKCKLTINNRKELQYKSGIVRPFQEDNAKEPSIDTVLTMKTNKKRSKKE